jgi:hypothetical protein
VHRFDPAEAERIAGERSRTERATRPTSAEVGACSPLQHGDLAARVFANSMRAKAPPCSFNATCWSGESAPPKLGTFQGFILAHPEPRICRAEVRATTGAPRCPAGVAGHFGR